MDAIQHHVAVNKDEPHILYTDKEIARGYAVDIKRVALAYTVEIVIVVTSLIGAWLFTVMYGNNDFNTMLMMMLAPIAFAVVEFCRVPLAIAVRKTNHALFLKSIIVLGLLGAAFVTVKSVSQLGEIMFRPRLFDVVHARERLTAAESSAALIKTTIADADALVSQRTRELASATQEVGAATKEFAQIKGQECGEQSGIGKNGRPFKFFRCKDDPRVPSLKAAVVTATTYRDQAIARLAEANTQRNAIDRAAAENAVSNEHIKFREAVMHSQLHSFTAIVFGKEPTEVTDAQIHVFLRLFVFIPAIGAAFSATIIALTAITKIPPSPPSHVELADDGGEYILRPLVDIISERIRRELNDSVPKPAGPKAAESEEPRLKAV